MELKSLNSRSKFFRYFSYFFSMQTRQELYNLLQYTPGKEWTYPSKTINKPK